MSEWFNYADMAMLRHKIPTQEAFSFVCCCFLLEHHFKIGTLYWLQCLLCPHGELNDRPAIKPQHGSQEKDQCAQTYFYIHFCLLKYFICHCYGKKTEVWITFSYLTETELRFQHTEQTVFIVCTVTKPCFQPIVQEQILSHSHWSDSLWLYLRRICYFTPNLLTNAVK